MSDVGDLIRRMEERQERNRGRRPQVTPDPTPPRGVNVQVGVQGMHVALIFNPSPPPNMTALPLDVASARNLAQALMMAVREVTQSPKARA